MHVMAGVMRDADGQALQWRRPAQVVPATLAPADRKILQALQAWLVK